jgi:Membrane bound beta barrel domain (DUF5777)
MKLFFLVLFAFTLTASAYDEQSFPDLMVPTNLTPGNLEASIQHRFTGKVDTAATVFGLATPVWASLGLRYVVLSNLEVNGVFYPFNDKEFETGASYAILFPKIYLRTQFEGTFYNYSVYSFDSAGQVENRKSAGAILFAAQTYPIIESLSPAVNIGYDFDKRKWGLGTGLSVTLVPGFDLFGEYFPIIQKDRSDTTLTKNAFSFGIKFSTAGHHFLLLLQNCSFFNPSAGAIGPRHLMFGADNNNLHFGFEIQRLFAF